MWLSNDVMKANGAITDNIYFNNSIFKTGLDVVGVSTTGRTMPKPG